MTHLPREVLKTRVLSLMASSIAEQTVRRLEALEELEPDRRTVAVADEIIDVLSELRRKVQQL